MQGVEHIYEVIQRYFSDSVIVVLAVVALLFLLNKAEKKYRVYAVILGVVEIFLFSDFTYEVIADLGESETFYRFLWMVPITILSAYLVLEIWGGLKERMQKILYLGICVLVFWLCGNMSLSGWTDIPENVYQLPDEQIEAAKIIKRHQRKWRPKFWDDGTLSYGIREYDGAMIVTLDISIYMDYIIKGEVINEKGSEIQKLLYLYEIDSLGARKENITTQKLFENAGAKKIGETDSSYLYRFEWRSMEREWAELEAYYNEAILNINEEYIVTEELEEPCEFLYLTDMYIDIENSGHSNVNGVPAADQFAAWIQMANDYGVDGVLLGANMLDNYTEANMAYLKEQLSKLEMAYIWVEEAEESIMEIGGVTICSVDNREENSVEEKNATVLLTYNPIKSVGKENVVELVLAGNASVFEKSLLGEDTLQYVGMPAYEGNATLFTIKGE